MTFGMKLRLWARNAPRSNVLATSAVAVLAAIVVIAALLPGGGGDAATSLFTAPVAGGDATAGPVGSTDVSVDGSELGDTATGPTGLSGGGAAGATTSGASAPGGLGSSSATPGSAGSSSSGAPVQLTASDQGVSETEIKVGFLI
ncbi:MAG TPA: hypothetical protein VFU93_00420, partial [Acidimicrobiales bacterium]|nr:hypothetical protein [Acidimicrobiales bacterium]